MFGICKQVFNQYCALMCNNRLYPKGLYDILRNIWVRMEMGIARQFASDDASPGF
jgi:hypothetical protein